MFFRVPVGDPARGKRSGPHPRPAFSCSICGTDGAIALDEPCKDTGMADYRLDQRVDPKHHSVAFKRLTEPKARSYRDVGGELPGGRSTEGAS